MPKLFMSRCAILIDAGYLQKILKNEYPDTRVDMQKIGDHLACGVERLRTYYYDCPPFQSNPPTEEEKRRYKAAQGFYAALRKVPRFQLRFGKLQKIAGEFRQKRVDIQMAVDLVRMSSTQQISTAVLITGDSDLVPAIEAAKDSGTLIHLYYSENSIHDELLQACDERTPITKDLIAKIKREEEVAIIPTSN